MPACTSGKDWNMTVLRPNSSIVARPVFTNININGRNITGDVHLPLNNRVSELRGECVPLGSNANVAAVHFRFRLRDASSQIGMLMSGIVFFEPGAPEADFRGSWIAHTPGSDTPAAANPVTTAGFVLPGSGDTGSGTGTTT